MKIAIVQPYLFPYIGYFQLINAVDKFIFYNDVNFIKKGWINRNQILINGQANLFSVPLKKASQNKLVNEIELGVDSIWIENFLTTLEFNYKKAPYYKDTISLIIKVFSSNSSTISDLSINSVKEVTKYLKFSTIFQTSSESYSETKGLGKVDRLTKIAKMNGAKTYINPINGRNLYEKYEFEALGLKLFFIENKLTQYNQFSNTFIPSLSIIDVLMFNSKGQIKKMLNQYKLV